VVGAIIGRGTKVLRENLPLCHLSTTNPTSWPGVKPRSLQQEASD
jgi:hypothetical protein